MIIIDYNPLTEVGRKGGRKVVPYSGMPTKPHRIMDMEYLHLATILVLRSCRWMLVS